MKSIFHQPIRANQTKNTRFQSVDALEQIAALLQYYHFLP